MDIWERFNEASLPDKEAFYSNLNMEDITDVSSVIWGILAQMGLGFSKF